MKVIKRNGSVENFDIKKIAEALQRVYRETGDRTKTKKLCKEQAKEISDKYFERNEDIDIELIQDDVENYLMEKKEFDVARAYIKYREKQKADRENPWSDNDERQDIILGKYLIKGESKKAFLNRISFGNSKLEKIFRNREGIWGGRNLYAIGREGNITGSNCFIEGTRVLTQTGYKEIQDIPEGEMVLTKDGTYQKVNATMRNSHDGNLIKLDSPYFINPIITTPNHTFLTHEGWVESKDLAVHKRGGKKSPHFIKFKKPNLNTPNPIDIDLSVFLKDIINEQFILSDASDNQYQPKVKHLNKGTLAFTKSTMSLVNKIITLDSDLAYVIGRYIGDGSITKRKDTRHDLYSIFQIVGHQDEKNDLDYCADIIERKFGVDINRTYTHGSQKTYVIRTDSIVISEFFNKIAGHGFANKFISPELKIYPSLFYGVFDSDGSIDSKSNGSITLNNKKLIQELKEMLDIFGIPSYIGKKINSVKKYGEYPMLVIPKNSLSLIIDNIKKRYSDDRVLNCKATNHGRVRIIDGEPYIQISSREEISGDVDVYNISVENNHDYVVENVHVHNCYVATDPEDSLEDIYRADYEIARTYSYGGGQGMNLSKIRPKGAKVNNSSNTTPGVMIFAEKYSHTTLNTQQESRRGALMLVMNIDHPDVIDFITSKLDLNKINGANISLAITDDFMKAYRADELWTMTFDTRHERIKKIVKARDLMSLISYAAHTMGDPKL